MARKGNKIMAQAMKERGLTDERLAKAVDCDRTYITRLRGGETIKSLRIPVRICRVLNVPIETLADKNVA